MTLDSDALPFSAITETSISVLVNLFYAKVRRDDQIGPVFNRAISDWPAHLARLCDFWSSVMLKTGRFHGSPMAKHMQQPIEPHFFDRWLGLWHETTRELFTPEIAAEFSQKAEMIGRSLKLGLFFKPELELGRRTE